MEHLRRYGAASEMEHQPALKSADSASTGSRRRLSELTADRSVMSLQGIAQK